MVCINIKKKNQSKEKISNAHKNIATLKRKRNEKKR